MKKIYLLAVLIFITASFSIALYSNASFVTLPVSESKMISQESNQLIPSAIGSRAFIQYTTTTGTTFQFGKTLPESCTVTTIGSPLSTVSLGGLVYINGVLYTWNINAPYELWSIDTASGSHTFIFNMTGVPQTYIMGMCWDGTTVFGASANTNTSQLFTVNMTIGVCTLRGAPTTVIPFVGGLMCRAGTSNRLFAFDISEDALYTWNKATGVATLIGPLGFNLINVQPCCDPADNKFYLTAFNYDLMSSQLRTIDTATGSGTILCNYSVPMRGFAFAPLAPVGIINKNTVPSEYFLNQNSPNPFNPVTKIRFSVLNKQRTTNNVQLIVYDVMGREVQTLVNERLNAGTYEASFDGSNLNSGVYFYKLTSGDFSETKRMLMIK